MYMFLKLIAGDFQELSHGELRIKSPGIVLHSVACNLCTNKFCCLGFFQLSLKQPTK